MEYILGNKQTDPVALLQILQSRFPQFDRAVIKWKYEGKIIDEKFLEEKIYKTFSGNSSFTNDNISYLDWVKIFDEGLKEIIANTSRLPILFFSGGKDSTFIASRLIANKIKALYISFAPDLYTKNIVTQLSEKLGIKLYISEGKLKHLNLQEVLLRIREPVLDPAGISLLSMLDLCLSLGYRLSDVLFLDGMGNDLYMGHVADKRVLQKEFFQKIFFKIRLHKCFSPNFINYLGKYGDLLRPTEIAHHPGQTIKLNSYYDIQSYYSKYRIYKDRTTRRTLIRGIHYDFGCGINKETLYADACDIKARFKYPFLHDRLINFFEKRTINDFDSVKRINKLSIRKYLNDNHNYDSIAPQKGIFEPTFLPLSLDFKQRELAKKMKIKIENLNKRQISDLYYWTKYVLNNQLDYLFKSEDIYKIAVSH